MDEAIATLNGCVEVLKDMDDGDARFWAVISALRRTIKVLEHLDEPDLVSVD